MTHFNTDLERRVLPLGKLLNDNDTGVDQLGYLVYAQALAKLLHSCRPPLTVGIFGPWGIGKTFLLKHVQGLLRKYELQQRCDAEEEAKMAAGIPRNKSFAANLEQTDTSVSAEKATKKPRYRTHKTNRRRTCICVGCTLLTLLVVAALCTLLIMVLIPSLRPYNTTVHFPDMDTIETITGNKRIPSGRSGVFGLNESAPGSVDADARTTAATIIESSTSSNSKDDDDDDKGTIQTNLRLYLVLFSIIFIGMVFVVFCCCIASTNSKCWPRFLRHYSLIFYAAFTRLPSVNVSPDTDWMEANNPYMVVNMNDEKARLRYLNPEDDAGNIEGIKLNSNDISSMPVRYIFVNYHAWQYAGSDVLWAGIVTNLAQAIENEFGAVCTRLFRMIQVERPSKSGPLKASLWKKEDPRAIYVRFHFTANFDEDVGQKHDRILLMMKEYGVVTQCCIYREDWWYVRFCNDKEANFALKALQLDNFDVQKQRPKKCHNSQNVATDNANSADIDQEEAAPNTRLVRNSSENNCQGDRGKGIPLQNLSPVQPPRPSGCTEQEFPTAASQRTTADEADKPRCCSPVSCCRSFSHFQRHPKTVCCGCPFLYCCVVFVVAAILFPITLLIVANTLELNVLKSTRTIPIEVQIFSWLPAVVGVMVVAFRFCWAMCNSQTERIRKALAGTEGSMGTALGFMNDVKTEVMLMTQLINCIRFTHRINYKIVITIDDLDRCPNDKVKSVLEAVSILLSDKSSPFLCLIAVDSRVAVKCIEQDMGEVMLKANLTGHEYLKKIINLPFCLPEVAGNAKRKYFAGIMDIADETMLGRFPVLDINQAGSSGADSDHHPSSKGDQLDSIGIKKHHSIATDEDKAESRIKIPGDVVGNNTRKLEIEDHSSVSEHDDEDGGSTTSVDGKGKAHPSVTLPTAQENNDNTEENQFSRFLFKCREALESAWSDKHGQISTSGFIRQHICGNPRNMKRIFNVLSLTTQLMRCMEERRMRRKYVAIHSKNSNQSHYRSDRRTSVFNSNLAPEDNEPLFKWTRAEAEDLVRWIVLTDQWPYRVSYILQVIDDSDQRRMAKMTNRKIELDAKLSDIYENYVEQEIADGGSVSMLTLDEDPALLRSFLRGSPSLTRRKVTALFPVTLNLDQSIRSGISRHRSCPRFKEEVI
ncbi:uncharacterized protein LOC120344859 isoform X1 [Styela clava]